ncbi:MAG TPA: TIGR03619 family F420-dependent LLM class oxidoreductase [Steroidobacteraceae bacterium]|jgi:probable F420-dependent oxidoreductase
MRISIFLNRLHQTFGQRLAAYVEVARMIDEAGIYSVHLGDHLVMGEALDRYPYGTFPVEREAAWMEPLTTLAAMSSVTKTLRLSTGVVIVPLRTAVLFAKTVATLDVLSGGRMELGVGTGWQADEYAAAGVPWAQRNQILDDAIRASRLLWTGETVSFDSPSVSFARIVARPVPIQQRIPILFGVSGTASNAKRIAELGDGWCPVGLTAEQMSAGVRELRSAFEHAGRNADSLQVRAALPPVFGDRGPIDVKATMADAARWLDAGATTVSIGPPVHLQSLDEYRRFVDEVAEYVSV